MFIIDMYKPVVILFFISTIFCTSVFAQLAANSDSAIVKNNVKKGAKSSTISISGDLAIEIYPNPVRDYVMIKNLPQKQIATIEIYNIFGRRMISLQNNNDMGIGGVKEFDLGFLRKGIYMIRIYDKALNVIYTKSISKD